MGWTLIPYFKCNSTVFIGHYFHLCRGICVISLFTTSPYRIPCHVRSHGHASPSNITPSSKKAHILDAYRNKTERLLILQENVKNQALIGGKVRLTSHLSLVEAKLSILCTRCLYHFPVYVSLSFNEKQQDEPQWPLPFFLNSVRKRNEQLYRGLRQKRMNKEKMPQQPTQRPAIITLKL